MNKIDLLNNHSNIRNASINARRLYNQNLFISSRKDKKYMILNPNTDKYVHFGSIKYKDFLNHLDENRRYNYLKRSGNIKGRWKDDDYSPNNLSRRILWNSDN